MEATCAKKCKIIKKHSVLQPPFSEMVMLFYSAI